MVRSNLKSKLVIAVALLALLSLPNQINSERLSCDPACGGNSQNDCSDYFDNDSSPDNCYSCAAGYQGGSGYNNGIGATCKKGECPEGCSACVDGYNVDLCYLCSNGFYDSDKDPTRATPCKRCHNNCISCAGPTQDDCLFCNIGYFDSLQNPYVPGSCDECDSKCTMCIGEATNCIDGCCSKGFTREHGNNKNDPTPSCELGCNPPLRDVVGVGSCAPECGGNSSNDCADFFSTNSSPEKCYTCAAGYVGGSGLKDNKGDLCVPGKCNPACAACKDPNTTDECYLCSYGFFDPIKDPTKATPCKPCHETCLSCAGPTENECLICRPGFFDSLQNPYVPGSCDECDSKCSWCLGRSDNCLDGCCSEGNHQDLSSGQCEIGCSDVTEDAAFFSCAPECGGNTKYDCSDYNLPTTNPNNCYSCAAGYIGGTGKVDGNGALCRPGKCAEGCAACFTDVNNDQCYLCSYGFFDSIGDRSIATPCRPCDDSCVSCTGPEKNQCLICSPGYFDSLQNPYVPGTCDECDSKCSWCSGSADNCLDRCCSDGFHANIDFSTNISECKLGCKQEIINVNVGTCASECGGNSEFDCSDFNEPTSSPLNCYSCAAGYIGGSGRIDGAGRLCEKSNTLPAGCAAAVDATDSNTCYLCTYGYYDSERDPTKATPCKPCHENCTSCSGPTESDCLICAIGRFDSLMNPYVPGTCDKCDSMCSICMGARDNCVDGCCSNGFHHRSSTSMDCVVGCNNKSVFVYPQSTIVSTSYLTYGFSLVIILAFAFFL